MRRIGLLGGSFNPAHGWHRHISLAVMQRLRLDEIWWLVSPQNPLKPKKGMASLRARLASARAVARHPRIRPMAIEAELGTRFAVDTVAALQRRRPEANFVWVMGADLLGELHLWRRWRDLARLLPVVVVTRPGYLGAALRGPAMAWLRRWRRPARAVGRWNEVGLPALFILDGRQSRLSATAQRAADPDWARRFDEMDDVSR